MINDNFSAVSILLNPYIEDQILYKLNLITEKLKASEMSNNPNIKGTDVKYKTELCRTWVEQNYCPYMGKCRFAHGKQDLNDKLIIGKNYKQKDCKSFHTKGYCPYGPRCLFRHDERKFADLNRPFYNLILQSNFTNFYFKNLKKEKDCINSESELSIDNSDSNDFSKSEKFNKNNLANKGQQIPFTNSNSGFDNYAGNYADKIENRKLNYELENLKDYSLLNLNKDRKSKLYRPCLGVFARLRPRGDSISFESTDVEMDFDCNEGINKANEIENFCSKNKPKGNFDYNNISRFIGSNKNSENNTGFTLSAYSKNKISNNGSNNAACNFSNIDKSADKNSNYTNSFYNYNNAFNCQSSFPIVNANSKNLNNSNLINNNYNNNLVNCLPPNLKNNAHLMGNTNNFINCKNNKNKFSAVNSNVFKHCNEINPNNNRGNIVYNQKNQSFINKIKYNLTNNSNVNNNLNKFQYNNINSKTNLIREDKENQNPNNLRFCNVKSNANTLNANHMPFYPSFKSSNNNSPIKLTNMISNKQIKKYENCKEQRNFDNNYNHNNNYNDKLINFNYIDNYNKIFSNSNLNFDFFGETGSQDKAENLSNTSILSTDNSHYKEDSIPNSFFNEIENCNDCSSENINYNFSAKNSKNNKNNLNKTIENSQLEFLCYKNSKQNSFSSNALDDITTAKIDNNILSN